MTEPFLGVPTEPGTDCVYAADLDTPRCTNPAVLHVIVADPGWYEPGEHTSVRTCLDHAGTARALPRVLTEHVYAAACADPNAALAFNGHASHCHVEPAG